MIVKLIGGAGYCCWPLMPNWESHILVFIGWLIEATGFILLDHPGNQHVAPQHINKVTQDRDSQEEQPRPEPSLLFHVAQVANFFTVQEPIYMSKTTKSG